MPYISQSVYRPAGNPGRGIFPRDLLTLINGDDIAYMPFPDDKGVVIIDDIIMKPGKYGINLYMTPGTIKVTSAAEGETDQVGFTPSVEFGHPGNKQAIRELKTNHINTKFIVIVRYCNGDDSDLIGTLCNPVKMVPSYAGDKDSSVNTFTFSQISKGDDVFIYRGAIPMEEKVAVLESGATEIEFISEGQYQLSNGTAVVSSITGGTDGALLTIVGAYGEQSPSVTSGEKIILKGGKAFVASGGSQITLKAFNAGGNKMLWIEQSRYEAA